MERLTRNSYPGILCGIVILILTGIPGSFLPRVKPVIGLDKVAHIIMYATFAFVCLWGYRKQLIDSDAAFRKRAILLTILISIAFGGLTEILQEHLVPGRTGDVIDFLADIIGTGLGAFLFHIFLRRKK